MEVFRRGKKGLYSVRFMLNGKRYLRATHTENEERALLEAKQIKAKITAAQKLTLDSIKGIIPIEAQEIIGKIDKAKDKPADFLTEAVCCWLKTLVRNNAKLRSRLSKEAADWAEK